MTAPNSPPHCPENGNYHILDCTHIIKTHVITTHLHPSDPDPSSCAPNCARLIHAQKPQLPRAWFRSTSRLLFICPICVRECIRADYDALCKRYKDRGGKPVDSKDHTQVWLYNAVMGLVREGGRTCEATDEALKNPDTGDKEDCDDETLAERLAEVEVGAGDDDEDLNAMMEGLDV
ncbi:uncharacterized protein M421DRAFT_425716 [Didymella exigua CBS 183.55]|uniref:Uncharacterized protein n=1 Tax=Didymella exigua CBS 183.55 TaxID=1150837 RepID=A0A6A5R5V8_9PLEO|nr:uncharacterized protein M421DRAFT_425716 [Didymella exigua CBS 183.55]KAF1923495.1 hypothetical protein M421DRAFT_425716 [Didymella exigua CBS 183.55]